MNCSKCYQEFEEEDIQIESCCPHCGQEYDENPEIDDDLDEDDDN